METRKESLSALKLCRFCLTQNEPLIALYEKNKAPQNVVTFSTKILTCIGVEIFPSDKMPQYICNKCKFFMELFYGFKNICRKSDKNILHFIQQGTPLEPLNWPSLLNKVYRLHTKSEFGSLKSVAQDGNTVKFRAEELSDSGEEGDDDNVYNVKIADGSDEMKSIKVITSVDNQEPKGNKKVELDSDSDERAQSPVVVKEGCWPCNECECSYPLQQLLIVHKKQKHRPKNIKCRDCDAYFYSQKDLLAHQAIHADEYTFQCVVCSKKFKRHQHLKRHEKMSHPDKPQLKCSKCPATFISDIELNAHIKKHEPIGGVNQQVSCAMCNKRFIDMAALQKHMTACHKKKPAFDCNYCPERFANMTKLAKHLRTHAGERAYPCKHCDKNFVKSHHYTRHLRLKHSDLIRAPSESIAESELSYRCEECEETFTTQDELIYHSALHATRSLTCPLCQEKFVDVDTVTSHIKSHVNGAEYMCDFCELIFTTQDKLDMHISNSHENEMNDKETQNEEEENESMDTEGYEDDSSINVKEEDGHMVVEIKKAGEYMLAEPEEAMEDDDEMENDPSEDPDLELTLDASMPLLESIPVKVDDTPKPPKPAKKACSVLSAVKRNIGPTNVKNISVIVNSVTTATPKPEEPKIEELPMVRKVEIKRKVIQHRQSSPVAITTDKKEKINSKVENAKVESSSVAGASDLSLRLLEKELQDLQRTNTRNDASKTPAKSTEPLRGKRSQLHTSTPKPRAAEKKEVATPKPVAEKPVQEKRPPGRPPKENKEVKNAIVKEEKEAKEKANAIIKEDKETKELKEPQVIKNGAEENTSTDEPVRRSTRPSKVKDYAKMISDSPDEEEETSEEEPEEEEIKETEKSVETPRRGRKPKAPAAPATPASAPRKRGRPRRKETSPVPPKVVKKDESEDEDDPEPNCSTTKPVENLIQDKDTIPAGQVNTSEEPKVPVPAPADPATNVIVSPSGQTLKKVPIKALPPGVKPMPLPRKLPSFTEMQIGQKMVKVQKIVMTKAEVEAMTKKGLVEMKDGTIVLKPGIKLPGSATLKSPGVSQEKKEIPPPRPTRCDLGDD